METALGFGVYSLHFNSSSFCYIFFFLHWVSPLNYLNYSLLENVIFDVSLTLFLRRLNMVTSVETHKVPGAELCPALVKYLGRYRRKEACALSVYKFCILIGMGD